MNPWIMPVAMNCSAPDTGNMKSPLFRSEAARVMWLPPILAGGIRSVYSMMETCRGLFRPRNISLAIKEDGDGFRLNGKGVD